MRWTVVGAAVATVLVLAVSWPPLFGTAGPTDGPTGTVAAHPPPEGADNATIRGTLAGYSARWTPAGGGTVELTVHLEGQVLEGGEGVPDARVTGHVNVTTGDPCWGPVACPQVVTTKEQDLDFRTDKDGTFHVHVLFEYPGTAGPPLLEPYCEDLHVHVLVRNTSLDVQDRDADLVHECTQSYPW